MKTPPPPPKKEAMTGKYFSEVRRLFMFRILIAVVLFLKSVPWVKFFTSDAQVHTRGQSGG